MVPACFSMPPAFQSTLPVRGATELYRDLETTLLISIHAPRAGSDIRIATGMSMY